MESDRATDRYHWPLGRAPRRDGGADSLSVVSPTGDPSYIAARPESLRVSRQGDTPGLILPAALADVDFRLHPAAGELLRVLRRR